jgi:hypothetical protein
MTPKQHKQILRLSAARLKLQEARLAKVAGDMASAEARISANKEELKAAGAINAHLAADRYQRARLAALRDAKAERRFLEERRAKEIELVKAEIKRKLVLEAAMKAKPR